MRTKFWLNRASLNENKTLKCLVDRLSKFDCLTGVSTFGKFAILVGIWRLWFDKCILDGDGCAFCWGVGWTCAWWCAAAATNLDRLQCESYRMPNSTMKYSMSARNTKNVQHNNQTFNKSNSDSSKDLLKKFATHFNGFQLQGVWRIIPHSVEHGHER